MTESSTEHPQQIAPAQGSKSFSLRKPILLNSIRLVVLLLVLAMWQITVQLGLVDEIFASKPSAVVAYLVGGVQSRIWGDALSTLVATLISFVVGSAAGVLFGFLLVSFARLEEIVDPYLTLLNSFPRVALAPIFIAWFGVGINSKIVTAVTVIFFIVVLNTVASAKNVDPDLVILFRSLGASRATAFRKLTLPWAVPGVFAGLKLALVYAVLAVIVTEMMASSEGLGYEVTYLSNTFHMDGVFAVLILVALMVTALTAGMNRIQLYLLRWQQE